MFRDDQDIDVKMGEQTLDRIYATDVEGAFKLNTLELINDDDVPKTIF